MTYTCKVTVLDKKLYPELQEQYCANPQSGKCPCFNVGDEFIFERNDQKDDFWHCGAGTLVKSGKEESQSATPREQYTVAVTAYHFVQKHGTQSAADSFQ